MGRKTEESAPSLAAVCAAVCTMALGTAFELRFLERRLFVDPKEFGFVLESIRGVLAGTPVSKSWQHRFLAPYLVRSIEKMGAEPLTALRIFTEVFAVLANVLLFALLLKQGLRPWRAFFVCFAFGVARCLLTYRLEYPWDEVDILLFLGFGYAARAGFPLNRLLPLLFIGALNHETILYLPAWFLLSLVEPRAGHNVRRDAFEGGVAVAVLGTLIVLVRDVFYVGRPALEHQVFEKRSPVIENHVHVLHNIEQLFFYDWFQHRVFPAAAFFATAAALAVGIARGKRVRAAWWTIVFLSTVVTFGYVNETRHYLPLLAFWFAYAGSAV